MPIWRKGIPPLVAFGAFVAAWQVYVTISGIGPRVLPGPARVLTQGWAHREIIADHAGATLQVTLLGFAISVLAAWLLAVAIDFAGWLRLALLPNFVVSQTLPLIVVAPLLVHWLGFGLPPKLVIVWLTTFFPIVVGLVEGFAAAEPEARALLASMGAGRWQQFRYVRLPAAMPQFFTSLRIAITYAVVGAIFAEYAGARAGLGVYMAQQKNSFRPDLVLAAVAVTAAVSVALFASTYVVQRMVAPWTR